MLFLTVVSGLLGSFSGELRASTPCRITGWHLLCLYALQLMSACCVTNLHWNNELCTSRCQPWACCACEGWLCSAWTATLVLMAHLRLAAFHWRLSLQTWSLKQMLLKSNKVKYESGRVGRWLVCVFSYKFFCFVVLFCWYTGVHPCAKLVGLGWSQQSTLGSLRSL